MFNHLFITYLESKGVLTKEQELEILEAQKYSKVKLGILAVDENLMTNEQADMLNKMQKKYNKKSGELAVMAGHMTAKQLESLLNKQPRDHLVLKEILTSKLYMTPEDFDRAFDDFKKELGFSEHEFEQLLDNKVSTYIDKIAKITKGDNPVFYALSELFTTTVIRMIDKEVILGEAAKMPVENAQYTVTVGIIGDTPCALGFSAGDFHNAKDFAERFAEGVMGTHLDADKDIAESAMKEFMNCVGGHTITELTKGGTGFLDLKVPSFYDEFSAQSEVPVLPLTILNGDELKIFVLA